MLKVGKYTLEMYKTLHIKAKYYIEIHIKNEECFADAFYAAADEHFRVISTHRCSIARKEKNLKSL